MSQRFVYRLVDPRTAETRYVGMTSRGDARPLAHLIRPRDSERSDRAAWLRDLRAVGMRPDWSVLEHCDSAESLALAEKKWIALLREQGAPLTNRLSGGFDGIPDEIARRRMGDARRGKERPAIAAAMTGAGNHFYGLTHSEESRKKISAGRTQSICKNGHPLEGENAVIVSRKRRCRTCYQAHRDEYRERRRDAVNAYQRARYHALKELAR